MSRGGFEVKEGGDEYEAEAEAEGGGRGLASLIISHKFAASIIASRSPPITCLASSYHRTSSLSMT